MSIKTALDFQALDNTYLMIGNMRYPFSSGILEVEDSSKRGYITQESEDEGTGIVSIAPFSAITKQGVVIWDDDVNRINVGQAGTFYIVLYAIRGETSHLVVQFETLTSSPSDDYIIFGVVTMSAGVLSSIQYDSKNSLGQVGHLRFKGIVSSLPDLNPAGDIEDSKEGADVKLGDVFVTISGSKAFLHIADTNSHEYYVFTIGSTEANKNCWGSGINAVCIDGTNAGFTAGAGANQVLINGLTGQINGTRFVGTDRCKAPLTETYCLRPFESGTDITLGKMAGEGGPSSAYLIPPADGLSGLGKAGFYLDSMYTNYVNAYGIQAKNTGSYVGLNDNPFAVVRTKALGGGNAAKVDIQNNLIPSVDNYISLGSSLKTFKDLYIQTIKGSTAGGSYNLILDAANILPTSDDASFLGAADKRWMRMYGTSFIGNNYKDSAEHVIGTLQNSAATCTAIHASIPDANPLSGDIIRYSVLGTGLIMIAVQFNTTDLTGGIPQNTALFTVNFANVWPFNEWSEQILGLVHRGQILSSGGGSVIRIVDLELLLAGTQGTIFLRGSGSIASITERIYGTLIAYIKV